MTHGQRIALIEGDFFCPSPSATQIGRITLKNREPAQLTHILTFNAGDFSRYSGITVLTPEQVLHASS